MADDLGSVDVTRQTRTLITNTKGVAKDVLPLL